ncbi:MULTISPECIES: cell division protein FtsQ/DivIB [Arthrobacter]|uniref:Cell division protein FtsQ/DivIB n=2 Tax=Arthrobacter TaxID=1663 RepID=A0ABU9KI09_9MICC|nr:cell division protein FtsQ/DivIB [Arthrobacter sp. YJM1]MDP5226200.1 cell division protein FtsQ/DivIB [Arthrobacter sp. YJM1]
MADRLEGGASVLAFPEPPRLRRRRTALLTIGGAAVVVLLLMAVALFSPALALKDVSVRGTKLLTAQSVQEKLAPLQGKPLPQISKDDVGRLLAPVVQIKSWDMQFRPPNTMVLTIVERVPVAVLKNSTGLSLVDSEGTPLAAVQDPATAKLPLVDGTDKTMTPDVFKTVTAVLGSLPPSVLALLADATARSVDSVTLDLQDGRKVIWGNADDMDLKSRVLQALLKKPDDPANPVNTFDVSTPRHPVTK